VQDARRHHVEVRAIDVNHSDRDSTLEPRAPGAASAGRPSRPCAWACAWSAAWATRPPGAAGPPAAAFAHPQDLALRARLTQQDMQHLAAADALGSWPATAASRSGRPRRCTRCPSCCRAACCPRTSCPAPAAEGEEVLWDYAATGLTLRRHPLALLRRAWPAGPAHRPAARRPAQRPPRRACGIVTGRQKPQTAKGTLFVTLEDETGNVQVIVWPRSTRNTAPPSWAAGCWPWKASGSAATAMCATCWRESSPT
jgi:error-prone DNA polymerase